MSFEDQLSVQTESNSPSPYSSQIQNQHDDVYCYKPLYHQLGELDLTDLYLSDAIRVHIPSHAGH